MTDPSKRWARLSVLVLVVLAVAACGRFTRWENPDVPQEQWGDDVAECRDLARAEADRQFRRAPSTDSGSRTILDSGFDQKVSLFDAQRNSQKLFERCIKGRGYINVVREVNR